MFDIWKGAVGKGGDLPEQAAKLENAKQSIQGKKKKAYADNFNK